MQVYECKVSVERANNKGQETQEFSTRGSADILVKAIPWILDPPQAKEDLKLDPRPNVGDSNS